MNNGLAFSLLLKGNPTTLHRECRFCRESLSLLSTRLTSRTVPPVVATTHPLEWTGDREAHTIRVLPSGSKGWTCKAGGDRAVCTGRSLHAVGGPHEEFLTMECAPCSVKLTKIKPHVVGNAPDSRIGYLAARRAPLPPPGEPRLKPRN